MAYLSRDNDEHSKAAWAGWVRPAHPSAADWGLLAMCSVAMAAFSATPLESFTSTANVQGQITLTYQSVGVVDRQQSVSVRLPRMEGGPVTLEVGSDALKSFALGRVQPTPSTIASVNGAALLTFQRPIKDAPFTIDIALSPKTSGRLTLDLRVNADQMMAADVKLTELVFPAF